MLREKEDEERQICLKNRGDRFVKKRSVLTMSCPPENLSSINPHLPRVHFGSGDVEKMAIGPCGICSWVKPCGHNWCGCGLTGPWTGAHGAVHCLPLDMLTHGWNYITHGVKGCCTDPTIPTIHGTYTGASSCLSDVWSWIHNCNGYTGNGRVIYATVRRYSSTFGRQECIHYRGWRTLSSLVRIYGQ